jgi:gas vesicle protein
VMNIISPILAVSDTGTYVMFGINIAAIVVLAIVSERIRRAQHLRDHELAQLVQKVDKAENKRDTDVQKLSDALHTASEKLIDERIRRVTHDLNNSGQQLANLIERCSLRLQKVEENASLLAQIKPQTDAQVARVVSDLKDYVRELIDGRCEKTDSKIEQLTKDVVTYDDLKRLREEFKR